LKEATALAEKEEADQKAAAEELKKK